MNIKEGKAKNITTCALFTALICVATMVIQIPIPLGYMHLGNTLIFLTAYLFGKTKGGICAGAGSALADLITGFAYWCIPTLIIKAFMGFAVGAIAHRKDGKNKLFSVRTLTAAVTGVAIMTAGYFAAGSIIYGSAVTGALQIPGLLIEGAIGAALFFLLETALEKAGIRRIL